jgi:hypothetical protein
MINAKLDSISNHLEQVQETSTMIYDQLVKVGLAAMLQQLCRIKLTQQAAFERFYRPPSCSGWRRLHRRLVPGVVPAPEGRRHRDALQRRLRSDEYAQPPEGRLPGPDREVVGEIAAPMAILGVDPIG